MLAFIQPTEQFKSFQKSLIGWKKAGLSKKPLLFDHVNRLTEQKASGIE